MEVGDYKCVLTGKAERNVLIDISEGNAKDKYKYS